MWHLPKLGVLPLYPVDDQFQHLLLTWQTAVFSDIMSVQILMWEVGIAQWNSAGLRAGVRVPRGAENFSLHHRVQTGPGAHPSSNPMGTRGFFPGFKAG